MQEIHSGNGVSVTILLFFLSAVRIESRDLRTLDELSTTFYKLESLFPLGRRILSLKVNLFFFCFFQTAFHSAALASLELPVWTSLVSNSQRSSCPRLLSDGPKACTTTPGMVVNHDCRLDGILKYLSNTPMGMSMRHFQRGLTTGKTHPGRGQHHPTIWYRKEKVAS